MKRTLAGVLAVALLASCGKQNRRPAADSTTPPAVAKSVDPTPAAAVPEKSDAGKVEAVSPAVLAGPSPEEMEPDEEDPSVADTDQMTPPAKVAPPPHADTAPEKAPAGKAATGGTKHKTKKSRPSE